MKSSIRLAIIAASLVVGASVAHAQAAFEFTAPAHSFSNGIWDFGWTFRANETVTVSGLGYYADPTNGFVFQNQVALYNSSGSLLASAVVDNTYALVGHFRYVTIAPITLTAGQTYQVDGVSNRDNYTWDDAGFATNSAISYVSNSWTSTSGSSPFFQTNTQSDSNRGFHGPNLFLGAPDFTAPVPEPETYALLLAGLGVLGFVSRRRKQAV